MKIVGRGFNFSQDGPGNRLVYHLQGCHFHCPWCSNPESIPLDGAWIKTPQCPEGRRSCGEYETAFVIDEILAAEPMFFEGGGVTFTGGEPTLQAEALLEILPEIKRNGIHTVIETNGGNAALEGLLPFLDLVIIDFKHYDDQAYRRIGGDGEQVRKNLVLLGRKGKPCIVRTPLIRWFNAGEGAEDRFAGFLSSLPHGNMTFELLPYHEYGKDKWLQCGLVYEEAESKIDAPTLERFRAAYRRNGLTLIRT